MRPLATAEKGEAVLDHGARAFIALLDDVARFDPGNSRLDLSADFRRGASPRPRNQEKWLDIVAM